MPKSRWNHIHPALLASAAMLGLTAAASASIIAAFDASRHNRFLSGATISATGNVTNPTFLLAHENLSGVGVGQFGGTLISPRHVLAAAHFGGPTSTYSFVNSAGTRVDIAGQSETRLLTNDGSGDVASDITIITLSREITAADLLTPYAIAFGSAQDFTGAGVYAYGQEQRVGRNIIDGGRDPVSGTTIPPVVIAGFGGGDPSDTVIVTYDLDTASNGGTNGVGGDEIGLTGGDSGHSLLTYVQNGELALIGAHFGIWANGAPSADQNYVSSSSAASFYRSQIETILGNAGYTANFIMVPEPALMGLLAFAPALLLRRRSPARAA